MDAQELRVPVPRQPPGRIRERRRPSAEVFGDLGLGREQRVLERRRGHAIDPGANALDETAVHRPRGVAPPRGLVRAEPAEADGASEAVLLQGQVREELGQPAIRGPEREIDLEQSLGCRDEALGEPQVLERCRRDVGNAPAIAQDLDGLPKPRGLEPFPPGGRAPHERPPAPRRSSRSRLSAAYRAIRASGPSG